MSATKLTRRSSNKVVTNLVFFWPLAGLQLVLLTCLVSFIPGIVFYPDRQNSPTSLFPAGSQPDHSERSSVPWSDSQLAAQRVWLVSQSALTVTERWLIWFSANELDKSEFFLSKSPLPLCARVHLKRSTDVSMNIFILYLSEWVGWLILLLILNYK